MRAKLLAVVQEEQARADSRGREEEETRQSFLTAQLESLVAATDALNRREAAVQEGACLRLRSRFLKAALEQVALPLPEVPEAAVAEA